MLPSANAPTALNGKLVCCAMVALEGVICTETSGDGSTSKGTEPLIEPCCAVMVAIPVD